jgi:hypothetical protein
MMSIMSVFVGCEKDLEEENMGGGNKKPGTTTTAKPTEKEEDQDAPIQLTEEQAAYLEECGISLESFYAMDPEQQKMILMELGIVAGDKEDNEDNKDDPQPPKEYTTDDVAGDGKFVVRIGDGLWNNYYLYYEDGVLVKVEAFLPQGSIVPVDSGVLIAIYLAFNTPFSKKFKSQLKWEVSPSMCCFKLTSFFKELLLISSLVFAT